MKKFFRDNGLFLILFAVAFLALGITILCIDKAQLHLLLNSKHTTFADSFFRYYTTIAEFGIYLLAFIFLFWKAGASIYLLSAEAAGAIVVQIVKHIFHAPRPKTFFDIANNPDILPLVQGVHLHSSNSFPSGHTCTFFVLFFTMCVVVLYYKKEMHMCASLQILCFILAILGAYSRIYLSQHFAADVFVGGLIGVATVIALYPAFVWLNNRFPKVCAWHISLPKQKKQQDTQE